MRKFEALSHHTREIEASGHTRARENVAFQGVTMGLRPTKGDEDTEK